MKKLLLLSALALAACAQSVTPPACTAPLKPGTEFDVYFGRDRPGSGPGSGSGSEVSEAEWAAFLAEVVTPRFPDGLSVLDVQGQSRTPSGGPILRERTKLLVVVAFDATGARGKLDEIVAAYRQRFGQHGVFRTEQAVCAGV